MAAMIMSNKTVAVRTGVKSAAPARPGRLALPLRKSVIVRVQEQDQVCHGLNVALLGRLKHIGLSGNKADAVRHHGLYLAIRLMLSGTTDWIDRCCNRKLPHVVPAADILQNLVSAGIPCLLCKFQCNTSESSCLLLPLCHVTLPLFLMRSLHQQQPDCPYVPYQYSRV